jgi:hypothetical protein
MTRQGVETKLEVTVPVGLRLVRSDEYPGDSYCEELMRDAAVTRLAVC